MAFPDIPTVAGGRILFTLNTAGGATKTFPNLSSLTKNAGDLLIAIIIEYDGNSTNAEFSSWGGGFTEFKDQAGTATMAIGCAYKWSTGSETGTFTVTTADTSTNDSVLILMSIPGAHASTPPEASAMTTSAGAPPAVGSLLDPVNWGAEDTLWIAVGGSGETATTGSYTGITAAPVNYTGYADSGITADVVGGVEGAVAFRQLNASSEGPNAWTGDTSNARGAALVIAVRPAPTVTDHAISVPFDLGLSIVSALARETFVAVPDDLGLGIVTALLRETFLGIPDPLGDTIVSNLVVEKLLSIPDDLGLSIVTALARETFISVPDDLGLGVVSALARETFIGVPDDLGLVIVSDLVVTGGGAEHFISVPMALGDTIVTALTRETFISVPDDLGLSVVSNLTRELLLSSTMPLDLQVATALVRETFLSVAENYGPVIAAAVIRETFIGVPDDLALAIYSNLTVSSPGGATARLRTLLGAGL